MRREYRECFPLHRLQIKPLVSDPGMHHGTCVMHMPWCMSGSLTRCGAENVPGIPGACATRNFAYLARGPWWAWCIFHRFFLWLSKPFYPGPLSLKHLPVIPAWMSDYIHCKVCDKITYPFPNCNGVAVVVWKWVSNFIPHFTGHMITYICWD